MPTVSYLRGSLVQVWLFIRFLDLLDTIRRSFSYSLLSSWEDIEAGRIASPDATKAGVIRLCWATAGFVHRVFGIDYGDVHLVQHLTLQLL